MSDRARIVPLDEAESLYRDSEDSDEGFHSLAYTTVLQYRAIADLQDLAHRVIEIHAAVQMDTPEDKAIHAKVIEALTTNAELLGVKFS